MYVDIHKYIDLITISSYLCISSPFLPDPPGSHPRPGLRVLSTAFARLLKPGEDDEQKRLSLRTKKKTKGLLLNAKTQGNCFDPRRYSISGHLCRGNDEFFSAYKGQWRQKVISLYFNYLFLKGKSETHPTLTPIYQTR